MFLTDLFLAGLILYAFLVSHVWIVLEGHGPWWVLAVVILQIGVVTNIIKHRTAYAAQLTLAIVLHLAMEYWTFHVKCLTAWVAHTALFAVVFVTLAAGGYIFCMDLAPSNPKALRECQEHVDIIQCGSCTSLQLVEHMDEFRSCYDDLCSRDRTTVVESLLLGRVKECV